MEQAGVQLVAQGADAFAADMKKAEKATDDFVATTDKGGGKVSKAGEIMIGALREIGSIAVNALADAAKATAAFVGDSVKLAGDFEAGMNEFRSVAGKDVDTQGLEKFRDQFIQLGKELPVSTSDVQQAAIEMVKGGIDPATIAAGGLRQNIQFAAAAMGGDLVGAATISSKILGGWTDSSASAQQKADFLTHSTDLLTKAANASSVDVHELSLGLFNAQGIAQTAGVSFDDLTTTLAAIAPRFASSSEAGNSLKNVIARLQPTTQPAIDAMTGLGLITEDGGNKFYDAQGKFVGFQQASQTLQDSLKGLTNQQQQAVLQTIFGNDAMNAAAALANLGADGYQHMADSLAAANGVQENAAIKQEGFNTALENAKGSVEALQITIGSALLPVLTDLINNVVAPAINTFTDMADAVFGNEEAYGRLSPALQDVVDVITVVVADVNDIIGAFDSASASSSDFASAIGYLADDLGLPGDLITGIVFALQDLVSWFGQSGDGADTLGTAVTDLDGIWQEMQKVVGDVMDAYMAIANAVLPIIAKFIEDHGTEISAFFKTSWDSIVEIVKLALEVYDSVVPPVLQAIAGFIADHGSEIEKILKGAWDAISALITGTLETIKATLKLFLDLIHGDWAAAWEDVKHIADVQWEAIKGILEGALDAIAGLFDTSLADIAKTWEDNWNQLVDIAGKIDWYQVGADVVDGIIEGLKDNWDSLMSWVTDKVSDLVHSALSAIGAGSPAEEWKPVGMFMVQGILIGFQNEWPELQQNVMNLGVDLTKQMQDIGKKASDALAVGFTSVANIDRQIADNLDQIDKIKDAFTKTVVEQDLTAALAKAQRLYTDPKVAAEYFKMLSDNEFETLAIRQKIAAASTQAEKDRLNQQLVLISDAQRAEENAFQQRQAGQKSSIQSLIDQLAATINASGFGILDDPAIGALQHWIDQLRSIFHLASGGPAKAGQPYWVGEQGPELFVPQFSGTVMPAAQSAQLARSMTTYNQQSTAYNMPIYTNQSPAVLQQSFAVMRAGLI